MSDDFDSIVVGAGIEGSAAAYHLANNGQRTLLVEQFPVPHSRGSSHGHTRIIRQSYHHPVYSKMMLSAYEQWQQLQRNTGTQLLHNWGFLQWDKPPSKYVDDVERSLQLIDAPCERRDSRQTMERFPMLRCKEGYQSLYEPGGGVLMADKCLKAYQTMFLAKGGAFHENEEILDIVPGDTVTVNTNRGSYRATSLVIAAGPWTNKLTTPLGLTLPLKCVRVAVFYWKVNSKDFSVSSGFPAFSFYKDLRLPNGDNVNVFGIPEMEYPNYIKICAHGGPEIDPDERDAGPATWALPALQQYVREHFVGVEATPTIIEPCMYTMTPDNDFILDSHPVWKNVLVTTGFSGSGFKLAPVVGESLGDLAMGRRPSHDLDMFKISRFQKKNSRL